MHARSSPPNAAAYRIWWLDPTAQAQLVGGRGHSIDLLDSLGVPPYLSEEVRRLDRRMRGTVAVPSAIGTFRIPRVVPSGTAGTKHAEGFRGVLLHADDLRALAALPGFVTDLEGALVLPPPQERQGTFFRRMDAALRLGCACGRRIDLVGNPPHLVQSRPTSDLDALAIRCEACAGDLVSAGGAEA